MNSEGPPSQPDARLTPIQLAILTTIRRLTQERRGRPPPMRQVAATVSRSLSALYYEYSELDRRKAGIGLARRPFAVHPDASVWIGRSGPVRGLSNCLIGSAIRDAAPSAMIIPLPA